MDLSRDTIAGERNRFALKVVVGLILAGAVIGLGTGFLGASAIRALGFSADAPEPAPASPAQPADSAASDEPSASPSTSTTTDTEAQQTDRDAKPRQKASFDADRDVVAAGERIDLSGRAPRLGAGESLQIQRREGSDGTWSDFPVTVETDAEGRFSTWIVTGRTGTWQFRAAADDYTTPTTTITIR